MSTIVVFDASGSMSGPPFEACVKHAAERFDERTPALIDTGSKVVTATIGKAGGQRGWGSQTMIGPRMLRECALAHDHVHYYTDGYLNSTKGADMPVGRVTVHVWGQINPTIAAMVSQALRNAMIESI